MQLVLPEGCSTLNAATQTLVVCRPLNDPWHEKLLPSAPALLISCMALVVSLRSLRYSQRKDDRARSQSIVDDYWLRKIVSPVSIEPLLKLTTELVTQLPTESSTPEEIQSYWTNQTKKSQELSIGFQSLKLIDGALSDDVQLKLLTLDDVVADYCGALQVFLADQSANSCPDREQAVRSIHDKSLGVFTAVKQHQAAVGTDAGRKFHLGRVSTWPLIRGMYLRP